ncbi:MAG: PKD domain-containing protein [bacterium]
MNKANLILISVFTILIISTEVYSANFDYSDTLPFKGASNYYKVTTNFSGNIIIKLTNIPNGTDYDLFLYNSFEDMSENPYEDDYLAASLNTGTTDEYISYYSSINKSYVIRVYSYKGGSSEKYRCYGSYPWDTTPPTINTFDQPNGWQNSTSLTIKISVSDAESGVNTGELQVQINDADWKFEAYTTSNYTYTNAEHKKKYEFRFKAKDNAGNWSDWVDDDYCQIDTVAPEITNHEPKDGAFLKGQGTVSFEAKDDLSDLPDFRPYYISIGDIIDTYDNPYYWDTTNYSDGKYDISYNTGDKAGNSTYTKISVKVDNTRPGCSVVLGDEEGGNNWYDNDGRVYASLDNWDYGSGVSKTWINWTADVSGNGGTWTEISPSDKSEWYVYIGEGERYCWYRVQDKAGNENKTYDYITIDKTPPTAKAGNDKEINEDTSTEFDASGSTDNIGIYKYEWDWENDGEYDDLTFLTSIIYHTYDEPGIYTARLRVTDYASNIDTDILKVTVRDITLPKAWVVSLGDEPDTDTKYDNDGTIYATLWNDDNVGVIKTWINWTADYWGDGGTWIEIPISTTSISHYYDTDGEKYCWYRAQDAAGNMGTCTLPQVIIVDRQPPIADAGYDKWVYEEETVRFDGSASYDNFEIVVYKWDFENDGYYDEEGMIVSWTFWDPGTYTTKLYVEDGAGNPGTDIIQVVVLDATAPGKPTGVQASPDVLQITVSWNPNPDLDLNCYCVHIKDDEYITPYNFDYCIFVDKSLTSYTFENLVKLEPYYFIVTAIDNSWNESEASDKVSATPLSPVDIIPPFPPTNLQINDPGNGSELDLSWTAPPDNDVSYYNVYEGDTGMPTKESYYYKYDGLAYNITNTSFTAYQLTSGQRYYYGITAVDTSGNESELSQINSEIPEDLTKPGPPWGLSAIGGENIVYLGWIGSIDTVAGYNVYRKPAGGNYTKIASLVKDTYYDDTDVIADTTYYYYIKAESEFGIESDASNESYATPYVTPPLDTTPPARPTVTDITEKETEIDLVWSKSTEGDWASYHVYKLIDSTWEEVDNITDRGHNYYADYGLQPDTTYKYKMTARDISLNESDAYEVECKTQPQFIYIKSINPNIIDPYAEIPTNYVDITYYLREECECVTLEIYNSDSGELIFNAVDSQPEVSTTAFDPTFRWDGHKQGTSEWVDNGHYDVKIIATLSPTKRRQLRQPVRREDRRNRTVEVSVGRPVVVITSPSNNSRFSLGVNPVETYQIKCQAIGTDEGGNIVLNPTINWELKLKWQATYHTYQGTVTGFTNPFNTRFNTGGRLMITALFTHRQTATNSITGSIIGTNPNRATMNPQFPSDRLRAIAWTETNWTQFRGGQPLQNQSSSARGVMQIIELYWHENSHIAHNDYNRMAWQWDYNIAAGVDIFNYTYQSQTQDQRENWNESQRVDAATYGYKWGISAMRNVKSDEFDTKIATDEYVKTVKNYESNKPWQ